ncbi:hypothetical protein ACS0TY_015800 [Phlomoides rotata]
MTISSLLYTPMLVVEFFLVQRAEEIEWGRAFSESITHRVCVSPLIVALLWANTLVSYALFAMQTYLTDVWKLSFTHAAGIMNIWGGISKVLQLFVVFIIDTLLGNFMMLLVSSISYIVGMTLLVMSMPPVLANATGTCKKYEAECIGQTQKVLFYVGMALIAVGMAGYVAGNNFLMAQKEEELTPVTGFLRRTGFIIGSLVSIAGFFVFPYIKQWLLLFGVPGIFLVWAALLFLSGWNIYNKSGPEGSPVSDVCRVLVAAALKISQPFPPDANHLYKEDDEGHKSFPPSRFLRCLEKAAIILPDQSVEDQVRNRWKLCSIEQVEAAKFVLRVIPIGTTFIVCTIVSSVGNTFLVEQGSHMNRRLGKWKVPSQVLLVLFSSGKWFFSKLADCLVKKSRIYGPPSAIAVAMLFSVLCCVTAGVIEIERLKVVKRHGLLNKPEEAVPMAAFWLFFPFFLLAGLDSFLSKGVDAFYERGSPDPLRHYCPHFTYAVSGLGLMYSVISVYVVGKISETGGREGWFQDSLNKSRLDRYYLALAGLSALNLIIFIPLAFLNQKHQPRETSTEEVVEDE